MQYLERITSDLELGAHYIALSGDTPVAATIDVGYGVNLDIDNDGNLLGVEILTVGVK